MYDAMEFEIEGVTPTICHNGQTCDPLNRFAKAIKEISGKRKKSDKDYEDMARLEWEAGFYFDKDMKPCWPGQNIKRMILDAAKKSKEGPLAKTGVIVSGLFPILYQGPKDVEGMWNDDNFRIAAKVKVQQSSVIRTRPIFPEWRLKFTVMTNSEIVNKNQVKQWITTAGQIIGLSDWRPDYGQFSVVSK